ncbi:MAG: hypothetical protein LUE93_13110, partial [Bacteroides sp.]|nr:hypothetical protein [Bacteroides sp.]
SVMGGVGRFHTRTGKIEYLFEKHPKIDYFKMNYEIYGVEDHTFAVVGESGIYYYNIETDSVWVPELDDPQNPKFHDRGLNITAFLKTAVPWNGTEPRTD